MFGPLIFPFGESSSYQRSCCSNLGDDDDLESVPCLLCSKEFLFPDEKEVCLSHLLQEHFVVISDVHLIADLARYIRFWKERFQNSDNFKQYCTTLLADAKNKLTGVVQEKQEFYLLSEAEVLDKELREKLQKERLETVLEQQRIEREDTTFSHECLYCRQSLSPTRSDFLNHLSSEHNLQLGKPSNLVYVDKLIEIIEDKMNKLQCIYCEKFFKDRNVLKEHMRKKAHKRVNPNNEMYDKFYIINYIEPGKSWKEREKLRRKKTSHSGSTGDDEDDDSEGEEENCDWSDWEDDFQQPIVCLFCELTFHSWTAVLSHLKNQHSFNYEELTLSLDFYEQVKLVNYIRRQVYRNCCITCNGEFPSRNELLKHMTTEKHIDMPQRSLWNQPEFYFPTYENDAFLCQIDDKKDEEENTEISEALSEIKTLTDNAVTDRDQFEESSCPMDI